MLLVASETGHVYTFATRKLQPMITSDAGKALIQTCLNSPDPPPTVPTSDQRMSVSGYEETELTYNVADSEQQEKVRQMMYNSHYSPAAALAAAAHHSHNLFPPSGPPGGHLTPSSHSGGMSVTSSMSPFPGHPAPSPSPSHHPPPHSYNISPSLSHSPGSGGQQHLVSHSPPFLSHGQHPSARWLSAGEEASWFGTAGLYHHHHHHHQYGWTKPSLSPSPEDPSMQHRFEDAEEKSWVAFVVHFNVVLTNEQTPFSLSHICWFDVSLSCVCFLESCFLVGCSGKLITFKRNAKQRWQKSKMHQSSQCFFECQNEIEILFEFSNYFSFPQHSNSVFLSVFFILTVFSVCFCAFFFLYFLSV